MSRRQQYKPVPRGYVRVYVATIPDWGGADVLPWEMYQDRKVAESVTRGYGGTVTPLDIPAGALPGLRGGR